MGVFLRASESARLPGLLVERNSVRLAGMLAQLLLESTHAPTLAAGLVVVALVTDREAGIMALVSVVQAPRAT